MKNFKKRLLRILSASLGAAMLLTPVLTACDKGTPDSGNQDQNQNQNQGIVTPPAVEEPWEDYREPEAVTPAKEYEISPAVTSEVRTMFTLPAVTVDRTGIYEVHFKFTTDAPNMYLTVSTQQQPIAKTGNMGFDTNVDEDGYVDYPWFVYMEEGENNITVQPSQVGTFTGYKLEFVKETDAVALATTPSDYTEGQSWGALWQPTGGGVDYFFRDVDLTLEITESGYYDFSYFCSSINIGEFYLTITDENGLVTETCSNFLSGYEYYYPTEWQMHVLFGEHIYKTAGEHSKPSVTDSYLFYLNEGTYTMHLSAPHLSTYCTVIFGGAIFATKIGTPCEHKYEKTGSREVGCFFDGGDIYTCSVCGVKKLEVTEQGGHTYQKESFEDGVSMTCERCGLTEVKWNGIESVQTASETGETHYQNYEKATFSVTVPKAGVYRANFAYTAKNGEEAAAVKNAALINVTAGKEFSSVQAFNHFSPENNLGVAAGYDGGEGYADGYLEVYLAEGENTLELHTPDVCRVTLTGARFECYKPVDAIGVTAGGDKRDHTQLNYCFGTYTEGDVRHGLGIMNTMLSDNGNISEATTKLTIAESGYYDIGYFVFGFNGAKLYVTLTKGSDVIEMHTESNVQGTWNTDVGQPMVYENKLSVFINNRNMGSYAYLEAGEWDVTVKGNMTDAANKPNLYFGNAIFATRVVEKETCTHQWVPTTTVNATCLEEGYTAQYCNLCGLSRRTAIPATGHSYKSETFANDVSHTCTVCGLTETKHSAVSVQTASTTGATQYQNYQKTTFTVTLPEDAKSGIYRVQLAFTPGQDAYCQNAILLNVTEGKNVGTVQSYNHYSATNDGAVKAGYQGGVDYSSNFLQVYLTAGSNTLELRTPDIFPLTLNGSIVQLEKAVDVLAVTTGGDQVDHTRLDYGFGTVKTTDGAKAFYGLGLMNTRLADGGVYTTATGSLTITESGMYELSYFGTGFNSSYFNVKLTKDSETIELRSELHALKWETIVAEGQPMLVHDDLSVLVKGGKITDNVFLSEGTWNFTATVTKGGGQDPNFYFGNALLAQKISAATCSHTWEELDSTAPDCTHEGSKLSYCTLCGTQRSEITPANGHSYKDQDPVAGTSYTCSVCGLTEVRYDGISSVTTKSETGETHYQNFEKTTFTVNVGTSGIYKVRFAYDATNEGAISKNAGLFNVTEGKNLGLIQAFHHFLATDNEGIPYGLKGEGKGYASQFIEVYLLEGENTLALHTPETCKISLKGVLLELERTVDAAAVTQGAFLKDDTQLNYVFGTYTAGDARHGLGVMNTMLSNNGSITTATGTLKIAADGWYDLSYFVFGFNGAKLYVTLTKGGDTVEMHTESNVQGTWDTDNGQPMILENKLSVFNGDQKVGNLVYLTEGEWTVAVKGNTTSSGNKPNLYFGNAIFATKQDVSNCAHVFSPSDTKAATCTADGYQSSYCSDCGTKRYEVLPATGHSYKAETFGDNTSHTCTACGVTEAKYNIASVQTASTTGSDKYQNYQKTTFTVTLPQDAKSGIYRVQLSFTAGQDAYCQNAILLNVTDGKGLDTIQSYNHFSATNDGALKAGYQNGTAYSGSYLQVYLTAGENKLELRTPDICPLTLNGCFVRLEKAIDVLAVTTGGEKIDHTHLDYGFGTVKTTDSGKTAYGLGLMNTRLADGGNHSTATGTFVISESGTYEIDYLGTGFNSSKVVVKLTKGEETIELRSENLNLDWTTITKEGQTMLIRGGLSVYRNGEKTSDPVVLSEGTWNVSITVEDGSTQQQANFYFGNALFATLVG